MGEWINNFLKLRRFEFYHYKLDIWYLIVSAFFSKFFLFYIISPLVTFLNVRGIIPTAYDFLPSSKPIIEIVFWICIFLCLKLLHSFCCKILLWFRLFLPNKYILELKNIESKTQRQGFVIIKPEGLYITNTSSGILFKNDFLDSKIWKDFKCDLVIGYKKVKSLEDKLSKKGDIIKLSREFRQIIGIVFRAQNFDNYFMISIWKLNKKLIFRPHVRVDGDWDTVFMNPPMNTFRLKLDKEDYKFKILVIGSTLKIFIQEELQPVLCYEWILPSHYKINLSEGHIVSNDTSETITKEVAFRNKSGLFGFRNAVDELGLLKSLEITNSITKEDRKLFSR